MRAPGPQSNAPSNVAEWLPLLGSIVQALCGGDDRQRAAGTDAPQSETQSGDPDE